MARSKVKQTETVIEAAQVKRFVPADPAVIKCYSCEGFMDGRHDNYQYKECGLDNVVLIGVLAFGSVKTFV